MTFQSLISTHRVIGRSVVQREAEALIELSGSLGEDFDRAVDALMKTQGRVIVTGIGKSGHVGRKLAATLSSTGTPSFFVHAAEASHGDLGMIKPEDTLFILSNSGKSHELQALINHARRFEVTIIGVASKAESPLMRQADIRLLLPSVPEACPERIAPTTSTTMMLALGDALAVAAMEARGFSLESFIRLHPGGAIGQGFLPVRSVLRRENELPLVTPSTAMRDVVLEMTSAGKGAAGVVDEDGNLVGIITDGDLRRSFDRILIANAGDVMTHNPLTIECDTLVQDAVALMQQAKITVVFVMDREQPRRPIGLVNIHDLGFGY